MKKIFSLIIAALMLISLMPCVFAADKELEVKYNFDFGAAGYGETSEIANATLKGYGDTDTPSSSGGEDQTKLVWATQGETDPWFIDATYYLKSSPLLTGADVGTSTVKKPNSLYFHMYGKRAWESGVAKTVAALVIQIQIDEAGVYIPEFTFYGKSNLCLFDVYLAPFERMQANYKNRLKFENSALTSTVLPRLKDKTVFLTKTGTDETYLGKLDMYSAEAGMVTKRLENAYEITEEEITKYGKNFCLFLYPNGVNEALAAEYAEATIPDQYVNIDSFRLLTEKKEAVNLDSEFTYSEEAYTGGNTSIRAFAVYGTDVAVTETEIIETPDVAYGGTAKLSAPEKVVKGDKTYNFLYWAKGATMERKKIVSHGAEFSYKPYEGANHLLAVYEEANADAPVKEEYYNANGELLANGDTLPSMPGYGEATGWAEYKDGIYVAEYGDLAKNIEITVNGEKKAYAYGDEVLCKAVVPDGKVFMYWTKGGNVVSTESTYSFCAWEDATVEAVFGDAAPTLGKTMRKIILDGFAAGNENAIMAEFIGFGDALEKGIMFGNKRVAMTGDAMQFAVIDDIENADAVGYAIVREEGELKLITDGELSE